MLPILVHLEEGVLDEPVFVLRRRGNQSGGLKGHGRSSPSEEFYLKEARVDPNLGRFVNGGLVLAQWLRDFLETTQRGQQDPEKGKGTADGHYQDGRAYPDDNSEDSSH